MIDPATLIAYLAIPPRIREQWRRPLRAAADTPSDRRQASRPVLLAR
jgi:hypothetical protein